MDYLVTLVSLDHQWLPVYTGLPPCQSICGCHSYSGIPGPSMVTSVYWSTPLVRVSVDAIVTLVSLDHPWLPVYTGLPPLVRVSVDAIVTLVSLDHPWLPVYTGLPPCQSIRGCHSYSVIPGPSMVTSVYWSTPLVRVSVAAIVTSDPITYIPPPPPPPLLSLPLHPFHPITYLPPPPPSLPPFVLSCLCGAKIISMK